MFLGSLYSTTCLSKSRTFLFKESASANLLWRVLESAVSAVAADESELAKLGEQLSLLVAQSLESDKQALVQSWTTFDAFQVVWHSDSIRACRGLQTQRPRVRITAFPRIFLKE